MKLSDNIVLSIALFASELGLLILNILPLFRSAPKIRKFMNSKKAKIVIGILYFMFTWGVFAAVGIIVTLAVIVFAIALIVFIKWYIETFSYRAEKPTYEVWEDGYKRTLTYDSYYLGSDRYKDDIGYYWRSDDNGSTFYREK